MKKIIALLLALVMVFALVACSSKTTDDTAKDDTTTPADTTETTDNTGDTEAIKDGYFHESEFRAAPYFNVQIDGINLLDQNFGS